MRKNKRVQIGRTIGEKRERPETASERLEARKKGKKKQFLRVFLTTILFLVVFGGIIYVGSLLFNRETTETVFYVDEEVGYTIEVVDEDAASTGEPLALTERMSTWIGQVEEDLRELGYIPIKAVVPAGSIREVDFYLQGYDGYLKMTIDRGAGVSVEDADRMLRYLEEQGVAVFEYVDLRVEGKGYWK